MDDRRGAGESPRTRRFGWIAVAIGLAVSVLAGCGEPPRSSSAIAEPATYAVAQASVPAPLQPSMRAAPVAAAPVESRGSLVATVGTTFIANSEPRNPEVASLELVGTTISAANTFAVLKEPDKSAVTVREGDTIDGYTIAAIAPDHVRLRSAHNSEQLLLLRADAGSEPTVAPLPNTVSAASEAPITAITEGINTDQSIPEHVTFGPTGSLPEGVRQIGH
jgi:Type II secretion system protein C